MKLTEFSVVCLFLDGWKHWLFLHFRVGRVFWFVHHYWALRRCNVRRTEVKKSERFSQKFERVNFWSDGRKNYDLLTGWRCELFV